MKVAIVILNWNTKDYLSRFLPGLLKEADGMGEVIVADSGSDDGSLEMMAEKFPSVRTIPLGKNYGFTGGYNRALATLDGEGFEYYLLINSDIEVPEGFLEPLVEWMDSHPECGACGPKLKSFRDRSSFEYAGAAGGLMDRNGYPFCRGRVLRKVEKDEGQYDTPKDVLWVSGACLLTRASLWKEFGGLDDRFFAHFEEIDYCWRLQRAGHKVTVVPRSEVFHIGGGTLPQDSPRKLKLNYRNNLLAMQNNLPGTVGRTAAKRTVRRRMILDGFSALVYLLSLKFDCFKAVYQAHREFRSLGRWPEESMVSRIKGLCPIDLIPLATFRKRKLFDFLHNF
ncbi:MAG: glycosyltransferase family 2 protein [Bacteroidales bacterium]|nr:glycosyltransferase family 2 protein [Bacteroidales bacterium]